MKNLILASVLALTSIPALAVDLEAKKEKLGGLYHVAESTCRDKQSLAVEIGEYRDEGYPRHRVNAHAMDMVGPDQDLQIMFQLITHALYERPEITAEEMGDVIFENCMNEW